MRECITIPLGARSYDIRVGPGLIEEAGALLAPLARGPVPVVTDNNVAQHYLQKFVDVLAAAGIEARPIVLDAGEGTKSFRWLEMLVGELLAAGVDRGGLIVALGGGVIGDLTGFAAGILKRGIDYAQVPTTLLSQVDSSVGGKTGINTAEGKNLVGMFHQPRLVLADTQTLSTLPRRELLAGYAEVAKYGAMGDAGFFAWLETNAAGALQGEPEAVVRAVAHCCRMKADIVARDERESGVRALLNLGHTFGHALEAATGYSDRLLHGEGVALGTALAFRLSARLGLCPAEDAQRLARHLKAVGLPTEISDIPGNRPEADTILSLMRHDKKAKGGQIVFILVRGVGKAFISHDVEVAMVRDVLG